MNTKSFFSRNLNAHKQCNAQTANCHWNPTIEQELMQTPDNTKRKQTHILSQKTVLEEAPKHRKGEKRWIKRHSVLENTDPEFGPFRSHLRSEHVVISLYNTTCPWRISLIRRRQGSQKRTEKIKVWRNTWNSEIFRVKYANRSWKLRSFFCCYFQTSVMRGTGDLGGLGSSKGVQRLPMVSTFPLLGCTADAAHMPTKIHFTGESSLADRLGRNSCSDRFNPFWGLIGRILFLATGAYSSLLAGCTTIHRAYYHNFNSAK